MASENSRPSAAKGAGLRNNQSCRQTVISHRIGERVTKPRFAIGIERLDPLGHYGMGVGKASVCRTRDRSACKTRVCCPGPGHAALGKHNPSEPLVWLRVTLSQQTVTKMIVKSLGKRSKIVTRLGLEPLFTNQCFYLRLMQLDGYAAQAFAATTAIETHSSRTARSSFPTYITVLGRHLLLPSSVLFASLYAALC